MSRWLTVAVFLLAATDLFAVRHVVFETDIYNRMFPLECQQNVVFSPFAAEVDCAVAAETLETIPRANVVEAMGVLMELAGVYKPLLERYSCRTNGLSFVNARGFCLPELRKSRMDCRQQLQRDYGAEVMPLYPAKGAECWFRAMMDGLMEDFKLPHDVAFSPRYSYYDLVCLTFEWKDPFPTSNIRKLKFDALDGSNVEVQYLSDVRIAETWDEREWMVLKLPLKDDCVFYALLPKGETTLARVREEFSSIEIESFITKTGEAPIGRYWKGPTVVVLPRLAIDCRVDFAEALQFFKVPVSRLSKLMDETPVAECVQQVCFRLLEHGPNEVPLVAKRPEDQVQITPESRRVILNRPFAYFVYDVRTQTIPVAGQYTGVFGGFGK